MPEEDKQACEVDKTEEVFDAVPPPSDQSSEVLHPGEQLFHLPTPLIAPQRSTILGLLFAVDAVGQDHLHAVRAHLLDERIGIIRLVADEPCGQLV